MPLEPTVKHIADLNPAWPLGADPASISDDNHRNIKAALLNDFAGFAGAVLVTGNDGGVVNAYTLTPSTALSAYAAKTLYLLTPTVDNTGPVTYNVSGLGARAVNNVIGGPLSAGELVAGSKYLAVDTGTAMQLVAVTKGYIDQLAQGSTLPAIPAGPTPYPFIGRNGIAAFAGSVMPRSPRTANTQLVKLDSGQEIDITAGTFTQTFDPVANLQTGWYVLLRNSGSGDITVDPSGAETIDGLTSFVMYPGECRAVFCDGSAIFSTVLHGFTKTYTASGTFIKPPGYAQFSGMAWSGAQGGGRDNAPGGILPGAYAGGAFPFTLLSSAVGVSETVIIGAGGAAVTGVQASGNPGGNTSFGAFFTVVGATTTAGGAIQIAPGIIPTKTGGVATGFESGAANINHTHTIYGGASPSSNASTNVAGSSTYGGGAGAGLNVSTADTVGTSSFGGSGGAASSASSGSPGVAPAGAGGATHTGPQSGPGARGELRISGVPA